MYCTVQCTVYNYICIIQFNIFYHQIKKTDTGIERESTPSTPATSSVVGRGHFVQTRLNFSPEGLSLTVMKVITYTLS